MQIVQFRARVLVTALTAAVVLHPTRAAAEGGADAAIAEQLFRDARALMNEGKYAEACPKFAESNRLDPGVGTLINLGECYEALGKTASAWATYGEAEPMARRLGQRDRERFSAAAKKRLAATLSYLTIRVARHPRDLAVSLDETSVPEAAWGTSVPVDPGRHVVAASAAQHKPWKTELEVKEPSSHLTVDVPELEPIAKPPERPATPAPRQEPETGWAGPAQRTLGWTAIGVGGAAVVTGTVFGVLAKSKNDDAHSNHCNAVYCDPRGGTLISQAEDDALASTIFFAAGAAALAAGIVLLVTAPNKSSIAIVPHGNGVSASASW